MVLGPLPVPGRPTNLIIVGQTPSALVVGAGGVVWTFFLSSIIFMLPKRRAYSRRFVRPSVSLLSGLVGWLVVLSLTAL